MREGGSEGGRKEGRKEGKKGKEEGRKKRKRGREEGRKEKKDKEYYVKANVYYTTALYKLAIPSNLTRTAIIFFFFFHLNGQFFTP